MEDNQRGESKYNQLLHSDSSIMQLLLCFYGINVVDFIVFRCAFEKIIPVSDRNTLGHATVALTFLSISTFAMNCEKSLLVIFSFVVSCYVCNKNLSPVAISPEFELVRVFVYLILCFSVMAIVSETVMNLVFSVYMVWLVLVYLLCLIKPYYNNFSRFVDGLFLNYW
jgi:hypothetical protein